ncbi:hypothetical protein [Faecalibaculum rodentium]|uniref:hypothetical protein n=1 Tax=Faecalibaculum rodentium TaxID=1702221 RepID=UPI0027149B65|nr:hypothetical protein [Faecalibaculum rodentium]
MSKDSKVRKEALTLLTNVAEFVHPDSVGRVITLQEMVSGTRSFFDSIWVDNFIIYLTSLGDEEQALNSPTLVKLAEKLAEFSPNSEANYQGNAKKLNEYAKKLVKIIWDCDTEVKSLYIANLTRALIASQITKEDFFKLGRCVGQLSDEDLHTLEKEIRNKKVIVDTEYIEEFTGLGLMYPVAGGSSFSKKAYKLNKYAINYEKDISRPGPLPQRATIEAIEWATVEDIEGITK